LFIPPSFQKREKEGVILFINNRSKYKCLRKGLRKKQTDAERKVWNFLRNKQILGFKFFRQYGVGGYILDFYCPRIKLAIEIDGGQHNENSVVLFDERRTKYLKSLGIKVVRFWNNDVLENIDGIYVKVLESVNSSHPPL
jgi:very-short-patch-repair endonuclease